MKLSYRWLQRYVNNLPDPQSLSPLLTDCGLEVEGFEEVESIKGGLRGIVIGEVLSCEPHPNADKLSCTTVDVGGNEPLAIVCGAPNVAAGQKVLVATVGTILYDGDDSFKIKKSKIRGEQSHGMICAEDELGLGQSHDGIMVLPADSPVGKAAAEHFAIENDFVYEIGLTPNRSDATGHIGAARDIVAVLNHQAQNKEAKLLWPSIEDFAVQNHDLDISIDLQAPESCHRYSGLTISNIKVAASPEWMQNLLKAAGIRPINNVVDITNFVMLETGQPLHAFDADKLHGQQVIVKKLPQDTPFVTLDEQERKLSAQDLMICDAQGPMCIAGVFGGAHSGVTDSTARIFLESACFDAKSVRMSAKYHTLKTDASFRFERGTDPNICVYALKRAALLLQEIAGGHVSSPLHDVYPQPIAPAEIEVKYAHVDRLIGKAIAHEQIKSILEDLDIHVLSDDGEKIKVQVHTSKVEVTREADIIEEILRIYGYNHIAFGHSLHSTLSYAHKPNPETYQKTVSDYLSANGYYEAMNNSLSKEAYYDNSATQEQLVHILNPLSSDLNVMRQSLLFGLLENLRYNINRKATDLQLYEFGKTYFLANKAAEKVGQRYQELPQLALISTGRQAPENWNHNAQEQDFFALKGMLHRILTKVQLDANSMTQTLSDNPIFSQGLHYSHRNKTIAEIGILSPKLLKAFGIKQAVLYADVHWHHIMATADQHDVRMSEIPKYPAVRRDLALVVDSKLSFQAMKEIALKSEKRLIKEVGLFDVFEGKPLEEGKKSYSLRFILQDENKTLTDKQIDKIMNKLIATYERELGALIRR